MSRCGKSIVSVGVTATFKRAAACLWSCRLTNSCLAPNLPLAVLHLLHTPWSQSSLQTCTDVVQCRRPQLLYGIYITYAKIRHSSFKRHSLSTPPAPCVLNSGLTLFLFTLPYSESSALLLPGRHSSGGLHIVMSKASRPPPAAFSISYCAVHVQTLVLLMQELSTASLSFAKLALQLQENFCWLANDAQNLCPPWC